jgi:hypothetical protein
MRTKITDQILINNDSKDRVHKSHIKFTIHK